MLLKILSMQLLQNLANLKMMTPPPNCTHILIQHVSNLIVGESIDFPCGNTTLLNQSIPQALVQMIDKLILFQTSNFLKHLKIKLPSHNSRQTQRPLTRFI